MVTTNQTIGIAVISIVGFGIVIGIVVAIFLCIRVQKQRKEEYVRLAIGKSLERKVDMGPSLSKKREDALMNARFFLRDSAYELISPLWNIGDCEKKYHFLVKSKRSPGEFLLTLQTKGSNCKLPLQSLSLRQTVKGILKELKYPFILPSIETDFLQGQKVVLLTVRPFSSKRGSLRDLIYKAKPQKSFADKYNNPKRVGTPMGKKYIRQFGRQILEGLDFLQVHGYPYPDLHCGNVIVIDGVCKLTDYEKVILAQTSHYSMFTKDQNQLRDFACLLFELSCGFEPTKKDIKHPPADIIPEVGEIIESIFFGENPPTLDDLIANPFFNVRPRGLEDNSGDDVDMKKEYIDLLKAITGEKTLTMKKKRKRPPPLEPEAPKTIKSNPEPIKSAPPPPPALSGSSVGKSSIPSGSVDRSNLLSDIRNPKAKKLKKVEHIKDSSAPVL